MITTDIEALRQRFIDEWAGLTDVPVVFFNFPNEEHPDGEPWVRFTVIPGASSHYAGSSIDGVKQQLGRAWLQIFIPKERGDVEAIELIEHFASIFRHWVSDDGALQCATEQIGTTTADGEMVMFTVSIPWESFRSY